MEALLYLFIWGVGLFLMVRLGCGVRGHGRGHGEAPSVSASDRVPAALGDLRWLPPPTDIDPVCGRAVETATAKTSVRNGWVYYFCSNHCRETFEATTASEGPDPAVRSALARPEHRHA